VTIGVCVRDLTRTRKRPTRLERRRRKENTPVPLSGEAPNRLAIDDPDATIPNDRRMVTLAKGSAESTRPSGDIVYKCLAVPANA
jgi:hypothetical protein